MSIGLVDTSNRAVRPITEAGKLFDFDRLKHTDPVIHPNGTVEQTVDFMKDIVRKHHKDVQKLADVLYDPKLTRFLRNVFNFVMTYVAYEKDSVFMEQLRVPLRTIQEQKGDCDCMSILIGCILYSKKVPFTFRITKYDGKAEFQHVYVIVPNSTNSYTVVDPVIKQFDQEKKFDEKKDFYMDSRLSGFQGLAGMPIQLLNGYTNIPAVTLAGGLYGLYGEIIQVATGADLEGYGLGDVDEDEAAIYRHLVRTRDVILAKPQMFKILKNPLEVARLLDYAIRYWDTPAIDKVLGILDHEEQRLLSEGKIVYPLADLSGSELGDLGFFKKIKKAIKKVGAKVKSVVKKVGSGIKKGAKVLGKGIAKGVKKIGKGIAKGAKAIGKFVARFNPVSLAARGGMLLAIRTNLFKLADKLQWGLYTEEQAKNANINMDDFRKMQDSYQRARRLFVDKLKGKEDKFNQAIRKGVKHKGIKGLGSLGQLGAATAALVTAAIGFITTILSFFKGKKNPATGEEIQDENVSQGDVQDLMNQSELMDEDGNALNMVNTTAEPQGEQNFWQKAGGVVKNLIPAASNFLPSSGGGSGGGGGGSSSYSNDDEEYYGEEAQPQKKNIIAPRQQPAVTTNVMPGGMLNNVGDFIKKNAVVLGLGACGIGAAVYFMTRKKKKAGLSGIRATPRKKQKRIPNKPKYLKAIHLQ